MFVKLASFNVNPWFSPYEEVCDFHDVHSVIWINLMHFGKADFIMFSIYKATNNKNIKNRTK